MALSFKLQLRAPPIALWGMGARAKRRATFERT